MKECKNCGFYECTEGGNWNEKGICHRYPPGPNIRGRDIDTRPPTVPAAYWCGEHVRRRIPDE